MKRNRGMERRDKRRVEEWEKREKGTEEKDD